ncbi:MAG: oligopeptidase B, partial [Acidimicrobiia bacterium]|nr:oligopeptidase B [Acidimicrobiia bacterium]
MEPTQTTGEIASQIASSLAASIGAPIAAKHSFKHVAHGTERSDDYRWLQDRNDPAVIEYLLEENRYADAILAETIAVRDAIYGEIESRVLAVADSAPVRKGPWEYFERSFSDQPYVKHLRRSWDTGVGAGAEEVVLDENDLAVGHEFFEVGSYEISPDHRLLAYALDTNGGEVYELRIRDLETSEDLPDEIPNLYYGVAWSKDSRWIFYTRPDEA